MYHAFTTDMKLFSKLVERFNVPASCHIKQPETVQYRVCVFLKHWVENDVISEAAKVNIREFIRRISDHEKFGAVASSIASRLDQPKVSLSLELSLELSLSLSLLNSLSLFWFASRHRFPDPQKGFGERLQRETSQARPPKEHLLARTHLVHAR